MKILALAALTLSFSLGSLQAVTVFHWGGNPISGSTAVRNNFGGAANGPTYGGFTAGNPNLLNPIPAGGTYSGPSIYGQVTSANASGVHESGVVNVNGSGDYIQIKDDNDLVRALILFKQADFEAGFNTGNFAIDSSLELRLNITNATDFTSGRVVLRLQGGSQDGYYISDQSPFGGPGTGSKGSGSLTSLTWTAYDPASGLSPAGAAANIVSGGLIQNVTEIGFYAFTPGTGANNAYRVTSVDLQTIPEPGALGLVVLGSLGAFAIRRRNVKN